MILVAPGAIAPPPSQMRTMVAPSLPSSSSGSSSASTSSEISCDDVASAVASAAATLISPMVLGTASTMTTAPGMTSSKETSRILNDYLSSLMRVQLMSDSNTTPFGFDTPNKMFTPLDLPSTAELMQRCLAVNPFEAKFREANQKISEGCMQPNTAAANQSIEALESMPFVGTSAAGSTADGEILTRENLKTADISKLLSVAGDLSAQAPRTADVLNAVLDMHSDRLHTINYLNNKPDFSALLRSPSSSAPNSASILTNAILLQAPPTTTPNGSVQSQGSNNNLLVPPPTIGSYHSPLGSSKTPSSTQKSPMSEASSWVGREDKQIKKEIPYFPGDEAMMLMERNNMSSSGSDQDASIAGPSGNNVPSTSTSTGNPVGRPPNGTPGRGRGRGRSTTADMQPDERRNTILERNKAAAVRYRKRKKEEHDDMMGRVQAMEAEKNQLLMIQTQNQVLRRELERLTALLNEREARCVCLKGVPMGEEHPANQNGMYNPNGNPTEMLNGIGPINGMHLKLPKMG